MHHCSEREILVGVLTHAELWKGGGESVVDRIPPDESENEVKLLNIKQNMYKIRIYFIL